MLGVWVWGLGFMCGVCGGWVRVRSPSLIKSFVGAQVTFKMGECPFLPSGVHEGRLEKGANNKP